MILPMRTFLNVYILSSTGAVDMKETLLHCRHSHFNMTVTISLSSPSLLPTPSAFAPSQYTRPPPPPLSPRPQEDTRVSESSWTGVQQTPLTKVSGEASVASLTITSVDQQHAGNYTCAPAALTPVSATLHVLLNGMWACIGLWVGGANGVA